MQRSLGDGGMPLLGEIGLCFDEYGEGWVEAAWTPTGLACNPAGIVHGGVYGVVHDAAMNFAVSAGLPPGDHARATLELKSELLRAANAGDRLALRGEVTRQAKLVAYAEARVTDADGTLVSRATATFLLQRRD